MRKRRMPYKTKKDLEKTQTSQSNKKQEILSLSASSAIKKAIEHCDNEIARYELAIETTIRKRDSFRDILQMEL